MAAGTLELLAVEIATALRSLEQELGTGNRDNFLIDLGFLVPGGTAAAADTMDAVAAGAAGLGPVIDDLTKAIDTENVPEIVGLGVVLLGDLKGILGAITAVGPALQAAVTASAGLTAAQRARLTADARQVPKRILDHVLITHLENRNLGLARLLGMLGIIDVTGGGFDPGDSTVVPVPRRAVRWDRLLALPANPAGWLDEAFDFGKSTFDGTKLLRRIGTYLHQYEQNIVYQSLPNGSEFLDAFTFLLQVDQSRTPPSLSARFAVPATADLERTIHLGDTWTLTLASTTRFDAGLTARITPPLGIELESGGTLHFDASADLVAKRPDGRPMVLLGQAGGSRLEIGQFELLIGLQTDAGGHATLEPTVQVRLTDGHALIDLSAGDGFVRTVSGGATIEAAFELLATWSPAAGLRLGGAGGLDLALPLNVHLGPLDVKTLYLGAGLAPDGSVPVEISGAFTVRLGPVAATVDRVGVVADLRFPDGGGNLGPVDLGFRFKPPTGVGLTVDAGLVSGGGFLSLDPDRGEYAGALSLKFAGFLELNAIGLISTRMPDGSTGFSLLIVITAEFGGGGIQLGYGFTLLAVGGIIGLNRGLNLDELVKGVRAGSLESVMFPKDVIANAPRIISDLRRYFPPERGTFLVGPMAKIGWGTPTLVSVSLGLIIEIPPGTVAILGVLKCVLPTEDLPLLVLQVDFAGAFEPDKKQLWFYAELFDSHILSMTIDGGLGLYVSWGDNPDFVLTVGGFHPSYKPPKLPFPVPDRLSVDILNQPGELIRVSGYFAVTSNTVQFGAAAQLELGFGGFGISGHLSFDALFQFSPFRFVIEISAGVSLRAFGVGVFGIDLNFLLEGPSPWRAHGRGSISLLFFEISADFDIQWGADRATTLPGVPAMALLAAEITKVEGWETRLPAGGTPLVTLRRLDATDQLVLHPLGTLFIRQRALPLDVRIDRVGQRRPTDGKRFTVDPDGTSGLVRVSVLGDKFAMAQFQDLDDAAKLARPGFEAQDAGLELTAGKGRFASARAVRRGARYELIVDDTGPLFDRPATLAATAVAAPAAAPAGKRRKELVDVSPAVFTQLLAGSSTSRSPLSQLNARRRQPFPPDQTVQVGDQRYVIAYVKNNVQAFAPGAASNRQASYRSHATAADAMAGWVTADPTLAGRLHVIPIVEMAGEPVVPGTWTTTANDLKTAVHSAEAVLLNTGKVLVAGGIDGTGKAVPAAAVLDPVTNVWAGDTAPMAAARRGHTMTVLGDGRVLVVGGTGDNDGDALATAEVYDPIGNAWSAAPPMAAARSGHTATLLEDGTVLVTGGTGPRGRRPAAALSSVEILDPTRDGGTWTTLKTGLTDARTGHRAVRLTDGSVLFIGGEVTTGAEPAALATVERYEPGHGTWTLPPELATPRRGHQATLLADGSVLVTGGDPVAPSDVDSPFRSGALAGAELIDKDAKSWTPVADLPAGRTGHRVLGLRGGALVVGGTPGPVAEAGYRTATSYAGRWTTVGSLGTGRWDAAVVELADGRALVAGGRVLAGNAGDVVTATAELLTL
jgi:hypothetical protein